MRRLIVEEHLDHLQRGRSGEADEFGIVVAGKRAGSGGEGIGHAADAHFFRRACGRGKRQAAEDRDQDPEPRTSNPESGTRNGFPPATHEQPR